MKTKKLENRIEKIKSKLQKIGNMRPGSLSQQYNVCGKISCCCKDPKSPQKHGPYHQLSYVHKGKSTTQFIKPEFFADVKKELSNDKSFKKLTEEWVGLALELSKERIRLAKEKAKKGG